MFIENICVPLLSVNEEWTKCTTDVQLTLRRRQGVLKKERPRSDSSLGVGPGWWEYHLPFPFSWLLWCTLVYDRKSRKEILNRLTVMTCIKKSVCVSAFTTVTPFLHMEEVSFHNFQYTFTLPYMWGDLQIKGKKVYVLYDYLDQVQKWNDRITRDSPILFHTEW